jgi:hypothetical protein
MIHITEIITYLRAQLPSWSIEGAVEIAVAQDASKLKLPAMYIGLGAMIYEDTSESTYLQDYVENFFIITCTPTIENSDTTGKYAQDFIPTIRGYLFTTLVNNKQFDPDSHVIMLVKDQPITEKFDRARYYHRFDFMVKGRIAPEDVTQLELDKFDKLFVEYVTTDATDDTPVIEQEIDHIYPV